MNWTIVGIAIAAIGTIWAIVSGTISNIDKKIEQQINNTDYIKKVAEQVRLPFIIFDENETFLNNSGGEEYVEEIRITKKVDGDVDEIIVVCKKFLESSPIIQSIDEKIFFHQPERAEQKNWKFNAFQYTYFTAKGDQGTKPPSRFKIEIIP